MRDKVVNTNIPELNNDSYEKETSSSAVAKRPRDSSCLSVVSFVASIVQYLECSFYIIS